MSLKAFVIALFVLITIGAAHAQVPPTMNYQGVLTGPAEEPLPDGTYTVEFALYEQSEGGEPIWAESHGVTLRKGIFNVVLGVVEPLDPFHFSGERWLGIAVEGEAELTPRTYLASVPYSFMASAVADSVAVRSLNGMTEDVNLLAGSNITITPSGSDLTIAASGGSGEVSGEGTTGQLAIWEGTTSLSGDALLVWDNANNRLGVGTAGPNARLRVESDEYMTGVFASTHASDTTEVIRANYIGGGNHDAVAIKGISHPTDGYGIGGEFTGGAYGLKANGNGGTHDTNIYGIYTEASGIGLGLDFHYGIWARASGNTSANNLGVVGEALAGTNAHSYGVYGEATAYDMNAYGVVGEAIGSGLGARYGVLGSTFNATDSVYAGYFDGNLVYTGSLYKPSDRMFKKDIRDMDGALDKVLALRPRRYSYKRQLAAEGVALPYGEHYGLVAQEVEEVLPELVGDLVHPGNPAIREGEVQGENIAYKGVNYVEMIPLLIQAMKEQQQTIEDLKREIETLKSK